MIRLPKASYASIHKLLAASPYSAEVRSVTAGNSPGWVFADDELHPTTVLIGSKGMEGFWLFSDKRREDLAKAVGEFAEVQGRFAMDSVGYDFLEVSSPDDACGAAVRDALSPREVDVSTCLILRSEPGQSSPPQSLTVAPISDALHLNVNDGLDLKGKVSLFWKNPARFERANGMGFCAIVDGVPTSVCMSAFVDGDVHCVDMETYKPFHRQGYGHAAASAFLRACLDRGITMHWSCMESNIASYGLARSIGLREVGDYRTYAVEYGTSA